MSTPITRPMLAYKIKVAEGELDKLQYPLLATPKIDGIRCIVKDGKALTRKFKPIPNKHIYKLISENCPDGFDGEIQIPGKTFQEVQSAVMSIEGEPEFEYLVFDWVDSHLAETYIQRVQRFTDLCRSSKALPSFIGFLIPIRINNKTELMAYEEEALQEGYEGVMLRTPESPYKGGRSTLKQGYLVAIKRFEDAEAEIIGYEEKLHNANKLQKDELGYAKRSSSKANLVPMDTLGALVVKDLKTGVIFNIGTGLDAALCRWIWANRKKCLHKIVTYTYQVTGTKDKPRIPSFKGFRDKRDM